MANIVYIATSIDGFIAKSDGDIDWLMETPNPEGSDFGFSEFISTIDAIVMGRITFEQVLTFGSWPYTKPLFVLSNTLKTVPADLIGKVKIMNGTPKSITEELNKLGYKNLYIDGGKTIQKFLNEELIDELTITRIPIILGNGIPLFANLNKEQKYEHIETKIFCNALVKSKYKRIKTT